MTRTRYSDFTELDKWIKAWQKIDDGFMDFLKGFMLGRAKDAITKAKKRTPVDTGQLQASWGIGNQALSISFSSAQSKLVSNFDAIDITAIETFEDRYEVVLFNHADYSSFQEFGFTTSAGNWYPGHYMLTISVDEVQRNMPRHFTTEFKQYLKSWGVS